MGSWKGRGNQYTEFARVLYCKLPTNSKQLPAFPHKALTVSNPGLRGGRPECYHSATVAPKGHKVSGRYPMDRRWSLNRDHFPAKRTPAKRREMKLYSCISNMQCNISDGKLLALVSL